MSKTEWGNIAAATVFGALALGLAYVVWGGESESDRAIKRAREVSADIDRTLAVIDLTYTPEQRAEHLRHDNIRNILTAQTQLWDGMPDEDWIGLTYVSADLVIDGICEIDEIEAAGFVRRPPTGHLPSYQTKCASGGEGGLVIAYPATMEYRTEPPG
jgi:hypothetical protein